MEVEPVEAVDGLVVVVELALRGEVLAVAGRVAVWQTGQEGVGEGFLSD